MLTSNDYRQHGSHSVLPTGCCLDHVTVMAVLWICCVLCRMKVSFLLFHCYG